MPFDLIATLCELVAIPSVNPMGRAVSSSELYESRVTDYLEDLFRRQGWPYQRQVIESKRDNILASFDGEIPPERGGPLILFAVHQDTVPVIGMTIDPWRPIIQEGRVYGRGACDIKGGMAALLGALSRLAESSPRGRPTVVLACTINEEHGFTGAQGVTRLWAEGACQILSRRPDIAIVAEPTLLDVVVAHKGAVRWRVETRGRAAHSSRPECGQNAIFRMAQVLAALEEYQRRIVGGLTQHPLCGHPTLSVGTIAGGLSVNTVPDRCTIEVDRRLVPGECPLDARRHVMDYLATRLGPEFPLEHGDVCLQGAGLPDDNNRELAERLCATTRKVTGRSTMIGVPFGTEASVFAAAGVPTVVFGPGSIDQAHTADEWVAIEQIELASEVLYRFVNDS